MDPGSDDPGCIRKFPGNFLMHPPWDDKSKIGSSQILQMQLKRECIRKFLGNFLIHPRVRGMDVLVLKVGHQVKPMPDYIYIYTVSIYYIVSILWLSYIILSSYKRISKIMIPIWPLASYRFVFMVRDRPPYPPVYRWRHSICFFLDGSNPL